MSNLILVYLETVLVCHVKSHFGLFGDSVSVSAR
jgi:hypothetical protein